MMSCPNCGGELMRYYRLGFRFLKCDDCGYEIEKEKSNLIRDGRKMRMVNGK